MKASRMEEMVARDLLGRGTQIEFTETFAPLGIRLRLETNSLKILEASRAAFGRYGLAGSGPSQFVVRLLLDPGFIESPPWPEPVFRGHGSLFYISVGRQNTAVADLQRRCAFGFVSPSMVEDTAILQKTFIECLALTMATQGTGATHTYVHASAVAKGDKGLIFSGPSESGKSTLAYACARRGLKLISDDVIYLSEEENGLIAWGRPWRLRFLPDCVELFPELSRRVIGQGAVDKDLVEIEVEEFLPGRTQPSCRPVGLFFLKRSAGAPSCEAVEPDQAVRLLARDLVYDLPEVMEKHRRAWMQLALNGSYILHCGEDLESLVGLLQCFL